CLGPEEALRQLTRQAGAVAALAAHAAAVLDIAQGQKGFFDDLVRRPPLARGDAADAAGVAADLIGVQQLAGAYGRTAGCHRAGTSGGEGGRRGWRERGPVSKNETETTPSHDQSSSPPSE